jgi:DNA polymerase-1
MILLIDGTNLFLRSYAAVPSLDDNGNPCGAITGTLRSLKSLLYKLQPIEKVVFVWDGAGGSKKRRAIISDYKNNRKPVRLNRNFEFEVHNTEANMLYQRIRLGEYLNDLPIHVLSVPDIEADDVISYLCQYYDKEKKIIASNDKDFVQLLNPTTIIYSTSKKELVATPAAHKEHGIHPKNFALARAMTGDKSDNLKGVGGVGFKTLIKLFPFFADKEKISVDFFFEFCEKDSEKYKKFLDKKDFILNNYKVMRLDGFLVGYHSLDTIINSVNEKVSMNATSFRVKLLEDKLPHIDPNYCQDFKSLENKEERVNE